jgi:drug/metabolite transporter (DMT)-like permease
MTQNRDRQGWIQIAAIAIGIALVLLLALHAHSGDPGAWVAILPALCFGVISPLSLLPRLASLYVGQVPEAPALPSSFQRPPPFQLA